MNKGPLLFEAIQENNEAEVRNILNAYPYLAWSEVHDKDKPQSQTDIFDWGSQSFVILEALFARYGLQIFGGYNSEQALLWAAKRGYLSVVTLLLDECAAEISAEAKSKALYCAARQDHPSVVTFLLEKCSEQISAEDKGKALWKAARQGHLPVVMLLLEKCAAEISAEFKGGALYEAALQGHLPVVALLLDKCAAQISAVYKGLAFYEAARGGHLPVVTFLLEKFSAQISAEAKGEALYYAASRGHLPVVMFLLEKCSAQISAAGKGQALIGAAREGYLSILEVLMADASVSAVATWRNNTALIEAQPRARGDKEDYARVAHSLKAFTTVINESIQALIARANKPEPVPITYLANLQLKGEERPSVSSVTEPSTSENPSCKRKKPAYH